ncbi:MAG: hypothetical protein CUN56_15755 [Phototrophicales bacterium]|nr:MAG: hypothetical protein CUN56_15755 [Phototrophicales bacterium]
MAKSKKQNINRELLLGGSIIAAITPLAILIIAAVTLAFLLGAVFLFGSENMQAVGRTMVVTYGSFLLVFGWTFWRIIKRTLLLIRRKRQLQAEQQRVDQILDTTSAEARLSDHQIDEIIQPRHVAETHEPPSMDSQSE